MATYTCYNRFFTGKGRQVEVIIDVGYIYSKVTVTALEDAQSKTNNHAVLSFDKKKTRYLIERDKIQEKYNHQLNL